MTQLKIFYESNMPFWLKQSIHFWLIHENESVRYNHSKSYLYNRIIWMHKYLKIVYTKNYNAELFVNLLYYIMFIIMNHHDTHMTLNCTYNQILWYKRYIYSVHNNDKLLYVDHTVSLYQPLVKLRKLQCIWIYESLNLNFSKKSKKLDSTKLHHSKWM